VELQKDLESKAFNLALQQIPEEHMRQAVELSLDPKVVQSLRTEHDKFKQVFLLVSNALTAFFDKKWTDALKALYSAKKKNETIEFEKARRTDILDLIKVFALVSVGFDCISKIRTNLALLAHQGRGFERSARGFANQHV
jgi:hypothetical protein